MIIRKIRRKLAKICCAPIEVFVFHAVSDRFDERENKRMDWSQTEDFKNYIRLLKREYRFISLDEAFHKLRRQWFRKAKYAVLTCDDGYASVLGVLPFLEREGVPMTLFINPKYLDGISKREGYAETPHYITYDQLWALNSPLVTVGMHGYEHDDATLQSMTEFTESVNRCIELLRPHSRYIPFFAYTWGKFSDTTQQILKEKDIIPVLTDGESNYHYRYGIGRKPIDSYYR